VSNYVLFGI